MITMLDCFDDLLIIDKTFRLIKDDLPDLLEPSKTNITNELELIRSSYNKLMWQQWNNNILNIPDKLQAFKLALRQLRIMILELFNGYQENIN